MVNQYVWMSINKLKLNRTETGTLVFATDGLVLSARICSAVLLIIIRTFFIDRNICVVSANAFETQLNDEIRLLLI